MKRLSLLVLGFAVVSVFFFLLLIFFRFPFPPYPWISYQDVLDLLTPLVLIPLYWLLFRNAGDQESGRQEEIMFMVLAAVWVMGQGMHLSANSVGNLAESMAREGGLDITGTSIYQLTYFFDEYLSHYLWHIGVLGFVVLLIYREARQQKGGETIWWATILAGILYGFTLFAIFLEGQTVPIGLPFSVSIAIASYLTTRGKMALRPLTTFFFIATLVATLLFTGWGFYWGGFPEFSEVGLI